MRVEINMPNIQEEKFEDIIPELEPLLIDHYHEIARNQDFVKLKPNFEQYVNLDRAGCLSTVTVRDEGELVGYFITFILPNMHYQDNVLAMNDVLFLDKRLRGKIVGLKMIKYAQDVLKNKYKVQVLQIGMKLAHDFGPMLERMGYTEIERIYEIVLRRD